MRRAAQCVAKDSGTMKRERGDYYSRERDGVLDRTYVWARPGGRGFMNNELGRSTP